MIHRKSSQVKQKQDQTKDNYTGFKCMTPIINKSNKRTAVNIRLKSVKGNNRNNKINKNNKKNNNHNKK